MREKLERKPIGQNNTKATQKAFSAKSGVSIQRAVCNWSGETFHQGLFAFASTFLRRFFSRPHHLPLGLRKWFAQKSSQIFSFIFATMILQVNRVRNVKENHENVEINYVHSEGKIRCRRAFYIPSHQDRKHQNSTFLTSFQNFLQNNKLICISSADSLPIFTSLSKT